MNQQRYVILLLFLVAVSLAQDLSNYDCSTVHEGWHYADYGFSESKGFKKDYTIRGKVIFQPNTATYMITQQDDDESLRCMSSWNKLYGAGRCGYAHSHHDDSDRFVWRRVQSCLVVANGGVIGEVPDCPYADYIEIAAYSYDLGNLPYQNTSLLTVFSNLLQINVPYNIAITVTLTSAVYELSTAPNDGSEPVLIESHTILHSSCKDYNKGYLLGLYFGGVCEAPQDITVCFSDGSFKSEDIGSSASRLTPFSWLF